MTTPTNEVHYVETQIQSLPADAEVAEELRALAKKALSHANEILDGPYPMEVKLSLTRSIISGSSKLLGVDTSTTHRDTQLALTQIYSEMRDGNAESPTPAITTPTYDTD